MAIKGARAELNSISAHLLVSNGQQAVEFYQKAFGAQLLYSSPLPGGFGLHAHMKFGNSVFMVTDAFPEERRPEGWPASPQNIKTTTVIVELLVEDADAFAKRAVEAGAKVKLPIDDSFWGDRYGWLEDPFGHIWAVASVKEEITPDEVDKRMNEYMARMQSQKQQNK
ncbi:MAG TPA: VOC family protein [Blastocatellia bacterium]|nr:VOC family protein [Blastocatellia bacterium]